MKLFELTEQYRQIAEDEDTPPEALHAILDEIVDAFEVKALSCARVVLQLEGEAEMVRNEEKRLAAARERLQRKAESLRAYVLRNMAATGIEECTEPGLKVRVRLNPAGVAVEDRDAIPQGYRRMREWEPDKVGAAKAMRNGEPVPGFRWAERTKRLEIR